MAAETSSPINAPRDPEKITTSANPAHRSAAPNRISRRRVVIAQLAASGASTAVKFPRLLVPVISDWSRWLTGGSVKPLMAGQLCSKPKGSDVPVYHVSSSSRLMNTITAPVRNSASMSHSSRPWRNRSTRTYRPRITIRIGQVYSRLTRGSRPARAAMTHASSSEASGRSSGVRGKPWPLCHRENSHPVSRAKVSTCCRMRRGADWALKNVRPKSV